MHFKDHFSDQAANYAAHRPSYPVELVDLLAGAAPARRLAWDCGCGSGQLSLPLAGAFERVIATDASREQIAAAAPHPRIEYRVATADASGLPPAAADLIVAAQAGHWFDLPAYYAEVRRVARPGAAVCLVCYGKSVIDPRIDALIGHFYSQTLGPYWPPERRHVEKGYRSLPFPFHEMDAPRMEMRAEWSLGQMLGYLGTWSAVRRLEAAEGRPPIEEFLHQLACAWGEPSIVRVVHWPLSMRLGRVQPSNR